MEKEKIEQAVEQYYKQNIPTWTIGKNLKRDFQLLSFKKEFGLGLKKYLEKNNAKKNLLSMNR